MKSREIYDSIQQWIADYCSIEKDMTWKEYFKMFSISPDDENIPNDHIPVDAKCSIFCEKKNIASIIINKKEHSINNIDELLVFLNQEFKFFGNITDEFFVFSKDGSDEKTKIFTNKLISDFY